MTKIGSVLTSVGRKALLLGSGELGKEVAIELQRLGVEVVACDKYPQAPAMQTAHRSYVLICSTAKPSGRWSLWRNPTISFLKSRP